MAFGDLLGTLQAAANSITNPFNATGSVTVSVGDLVYCLVVEQTSLTVTGVTDNLGNTYTALNAGNDAGAVTARAFYSRVTTAGTLTSISAAATASANNVVHIAAAFEGPFDSTSPLDANPANGTTDVTSPFSCPATGTLAQADELVVAWVAANHSTAYTADSPMTEQVELASQTVIKGNIASKVVAATTTTTPSFTSAANPTQIVLGTSSFKKAGAQTTQKVINVSQTQSASAIKQVGKLLSIFQTAAISTSQVRFPAPIPQAISVSQTQRASGIAEANLFRMLDDVGHGMALLVIKQVNKIIFDDIDQLVTLFRSIGKRVIVASSQVVTLTTQFVQAGGQTFNKILNVVQSQNVTAVRSIIHFVQLIQSKIIILQRSIGHRIQISQASLVNLIRQVGKRLLISLGQAVTLIRSRAAGRIISVTQNQVSIVRRSIGKIISIAADQFLTTQSRIGHRILVGQEQTINLINLIGKKIVVASGQIVSFARQQGRPIVVATNQVVTLFSTFIAGNFVQSLVCAAINLYAAITGQPALYKAVDGSVTIDKTTSVEIGVSGVVGGVPSEGTAVGGAPEIDNVVSGTPDIRKC